KGERAKDRGVGETAYNLAHVVYAADVGLGLSCGGLVRFIDRDELSVDEGEPVLGGVAAVVPTHNVSAIIDLEGESIDGAGEIQGHERSVDNHEAVNPAAYNRLAIHADDDGIDVDAGRFRVDGAGKSEQRELTLVQQERIFTARRK